MNRRQFILAGLGTPAITLHPGSPINFITDPATSLILPGATPRTRPRTSRMRWAQLAFVENDPKHFDPDFWLDYFRRIHADGALLSAGGVVAFYPTNVPHHHRSDWLGNSDPVGEMIKGCRKMNMSVVLRTDPHATRQDMFDAHPDYISVTADGKPRRHWANPDLWVTCAYGPYNLVFMTDVHREIMQRYQPDGIFSNRWAGHGICYCRHCTENFKKATGLDLPRSERRLDPAYQKWEAWRKDRLRDVWFTWDGEIRKQRASARFIPNGFPDKLETGKFADFFFADQQARRGVIPPWSNAMGAKELRAGLGMKPIVNIFSVGVEEEYRWKDSVQNDAEIRIWVAEGVANGMRPCFVKFGAYIYDKRWMKAVEKMYQAYLRNETYLKNTAPLARIGLVYSEQTSQKYGGKPWQEKSNEHALGVYQALVEEHLPFEMVNDKLLDRDHLKPFRLLILPNIAALSDSQCRQLRDFVNAGGSLLATFETSLYDEEGQPRNDFGLTDLFGVSVDRTNAPGTTAPVHHSPRHHSPGHHIPRRHSPGHKCRPGRRPHAQLLPPHKNRPPRRERPGRRLQDHQLRIQGKGQTQLGLPFSRHPDPHLSRPPDGRRLPQAGRDRHPRALPQRARPRPQHRAPRPQSRKRPRRLHTRATSTAVSGRC
ncbi:alpha-amylase family protein [Puia sp. P3]|uniref:alpha-amylase family protein n=1 Tax=Puia sp. P3 TaxID=3423952 RepID=UPI003D66CDFF